MSRHWATRSYDAYVLSNTWQASVTSGSRWMAPAARAAGRRPASTAWLQRRRRPRIGLTYIRQILPPVVKANAVQMHKLVPGRTGTHGRLRHKLMHPLLLLVSV
jgi:hypothetical protein